MKELIISEWERAWGRKKTQMLLIVYPVLVFLTEWFVLQFGVGFYDMEHEVSLHALNFPLFSLRDLSLLLTFVIAPMLWVDSFSGEYSTGAYRMVLIRPYSKGKLLAAKWFSQAVLTGTLLLIPFVMSQIVGWINLSNPSVTTFFYEGAERYDMEEAILYQLCFYGWIYLILLVCQSVCALLSTWMPNPILSFLAYAGGLIGSIYLADSFIILFGHTDGIFRLMAGKADDGVYYVLFGTLVVSLVSIYGSWQKKDWVK